MATYNMLSSGSRGDEVKKLQTSLINAGYSVGSAGADGIYGNDTAAAVRKYQQANGLDVDGIAGDQTLGKLYGVSNQPAQPAQQAQPQTETKTEQKQEPKFEYKPYQESDTVKQAQALLHQQMSQKPGQYQSQWQTQLDDTLDKILNREKFNYDFNADALYQQYKDKYTTQGKQAMMDTMGQAAALTGGHGNSYAQTVGQQTYQGYLQNLNDVIPELYQLALDQYTREGDDLKDQYALYADREALDYGRYRDQMADWEKERGYLSDRYDAERDYDYGKWADDRDFNYGQYSDDRAYKYQAERDAVADAQWQAEFDEAKRQYDQEFALAQSKAASGGGSGGGSASNTGKETEPDDEKGYAAFMDALKYKTRSDYYAAAGGGWHGSDTEDQYDLYIANLVEQWENAGKLGEKAADKVIEDILGWR